MQMKQLAAFNSQILPKEAQEKLRLKKRQESPLFRSNLNSVDKVSVKRLEHLKNLLAVSVWRENPAGQPRNLPHLMDSVFNKTNLKKTKTLSQAASPKK